MNFRAPQTPGIDGLANQFTSAEVTLLQTVTGLGSATYILRTNAAGTGLEWVSPGGASGATTALDNLSAVAINAALVLGTSDAFALGSTTKMWSDLFLADGAVINFNAGDVTLTHSANTLTLGGGNLALGANSLTMTGSIGATGARVTKGWFTDVESTNMPTVGGTAILTSLTAPQFTTIELGHASDTTLARVSAGVLSVEGATVATLSTAQTWSALQTFSLAGNAGRFLNTSDSASVQVLRLEGDRATMADNDEAYLSLMLSNDAGTQTEFGRLTWVATDVNAGTSVDGRLDFAVVTAGSLADEMQLDGTSLSPSTSDGLALGTSTLMWSDVFLASGGVVNFNNGDVLITHSANALAFTGVTSGYSFDDELLPSANDGAALGSPTTSWADLFLASGGVIGWNNSDVLITHSSNLLTLSGGDFSIGTSGVFTTGTIELGAASDTTISRVSAGTIAVEGVNVLTTATGLPLSGGTMSGNITLGENTSIDLDPAGSADGKYSGICITGTAGATLAFGDLIYLAVADSRWELTDADATATAGTPLIGMCVLAAAGDGSATKILLQGVIRADAKFPALTVGAPAYVGETAGAIQTSIPTGADNVIRVVGRALTADELYFCPSQDHQITVS